jgi:protein-S-isoprenylcysteine O-methyltransferase Ste14
MTSPDRASFAKSVLHNVGVTIVAFGVALLGVGVDALLGIRRLHSTLGVIGGGGLLGAGFALRAWAAFHFYERRMRVISLAPQGTLVTSGPFRFSRNPLYLGGNGFMFLGASLVLGTPSGLVLTVAHLPLVDWMIRREERQLEATFGDEWCRYAARVRRWL